jgi:hypothetical protein
MTDRHKPTQLDRRELLIAVGTLAAAFGLPNAVKLAGAAEAPFDNDAFANLANLIAGFPPPDPNITREIAAAFAAETDELSRLYDILRTATPDQWEDAIKQAGLSPLAEALMTAWYTGSVAATDGDDRRVITYLDAFAWYAVGYTKPPTRCDISFGAWSEPPHEFR